MPDTMTAPARRAVVAGGSGMIGRHLVEGLVADGWMVDILSRHPAEAARRLPTTVAVVRWGPGRTTGLAQVLGSADAVINLAGASLGTRPWTPGRRREILESRLDATNALVEAIAALPPDHRPQVLVNASGTDLYTGRDEVPADESTPPATDFLADVVRQWEAAALRAEPLGVRVVAVRQGIVLAPDATVLRLVALPFRLYLGGRVGSGRQWFSWIHVDDLVGIYRLALGVPTLHGPINATAPSPSRQSDVAATIARVLHRPNRLPVPAWIVRLALFGGQSTLLLGSRRVVPKRAQELGFEFDHPILEEALAASLE